MTRSILLAGALLLLISISPINAEASEAPWCAVMGDGDLPWACKYRSIEECRSNGIAGNRGFCNPNPAYVANPPELKNSRQASPMGSKTIAEKTIAVKKKTIAEKTIAVEKQSPRHRNANARTKIVASPITVESPRQHDKSNAESKDTVATKIETPQPAQSDGKSDAESKDTVATKIESPQPAQSDDKSDAESKDTVATKIETPQPAQSDGKSNAESKDTVATKIETPQPAQLNETVIKKAKIMVAAKMEDPASVEFVDIERAMNKNTTFEILCGHVKGKKKSGEATRETPFLYLVKEDEAYIVDGGPYSTTAKMYRTNCTSASSR